MASCIHNECLFRNNWVYYKEYGNPVLAVPFYKLPEEEKERDRQKLRQAIEKVEQYKLSNKIKTIK